MLVITSDHVTILLLYPDVHSVSSYLFPQPICNAANHVGRLAPDHDVAIQLGEIIEYCYYSTFS